MRFLHLGLLATALVLSSPAIAQEDARIVDTVIRDTLPAGQGQWRSKVQNVFDPVTRRLEARHYETLDLEPARNLDFLWQPAHLDSDRSGRIAGKGLLIWRERGAPVYEQAALWSSYQGNMRAGRAAGYGVLTTRDGVHYEGEWRDGRFHGQGRLQFSNGEEYQGRFAGGIAEGAGRFTDLTGEMFEGPFVAGLRHGAGKTTLPGGATYHSQWARGVEAPNSVAIRVAQAGGTAGGTTTEPLRLGVSVLKKPKTQYRDEKNSLGYVSKTSGTTLSVEPDDPDLVSMWKKRGMITEKSYGGDRDSVFGINKNVMYPPKFSFDFQNRSSSAVEVAEVYLQVASSISDNQPALVITKGRERPACAVRDKNGSAGTYSPNFALDNFGWGKLENAKINFAFTHPKTGRSLPAQSRAIPAFDKTAVIDLSEQLRGNGADTKALAGAGKSALTCSCNISPDDDSSGSSFCSKESANQCISEALARPMFGRLSSVAAVEGIDVNVLMKGTISYEYSDHKNEKVAVTQPIQSKITIGGFLDSPECGEGGPPDPLRNKPLALKLDETNYRLPIPLAKSRRVDPGRTHQFTLEVNAPKASQHKFEVVAKLSDGREIRSRPVELLYFRPRWHPETE